MIDARSRAAAAVAASVALGAASLRCASSDGLTGEVLRGPAPSSAEDGSGTTDGAAPRSCKSGALDVGFGNGGVVTIPISRRATLGSLLVHTDGSIVLVGGVDADTSPSAVVVKLSADGRPDPSFGSGGVVRTTAGGLRTANGGAIAPDGHVLVIGPALGATGRDGVVAQLDPHGSIDAAFGSGGIVKLDYGSDDEGALLARQPDGQLVAAVRSFLPGNVSAIRLTRLAPNGVIDTGFGPGGTASIVVGNSNYLTSLALQPDGKILTGAVHCCPPSVETFMVARVGTDGRFDVGFGTGGYVITDVAETAQALAVAVAPDGRIVAAGQAGVPTETAGSLAAALALVRYQPNGVRDQGFGENGVVLVRPFDAPSAIARQVLTSPSGSVFVGLELRADADAAAPAQAGILRFAADGRLDPGYGSDGIALASSGPATVGGLAVAEGGAAIIAGTSQSSEQASFYVARVCP